jgi:hypothetical protein
MNSIYVKRIILLSLIFFGGTQVYSQSLQLPKQHRGRNHRGFYLSMAPGANLTNVKMNDNDGSTSFKGLGGGWDIKIGGTLKENLIVHATILMHSVYEPKIYDSSIGLNGTKAEKIDLFESMIGAGITYYTPENFLLSPSIGFGGFTLTDEKKDEDSSSDKGFSFQLKAGKEWWISPRWGIGLAVYYHNTNVLNQKGKADEERIKSNNFGIVLNATLNGRK